MSIKLGDIAPNFTANTTEGEIDFHSWIGDSWTLLMSHPADYTPVCTTELGKVANLKKEFDKRNVKAIALSVDPLESHKGWIKDINSTQNANVNFPLIADQDNKIADLYDMIHPNASNTHTVRTLFVIAPDKTVKLTLTYPPSTGRNFAEVLRVIDSLQLTANQKVATPANWTQGEDCVVLPTIKTEDIPDLFPKGFTEVTSYLRTTPQPIDLE
ncbi:MAG: peroxiredoxin [SAR202 cluster bacterium]|nr:peroxiredoxin [SAR202 cluster bacterium]|tara:strand:+ start:4964 stop:5605 length:642 start_codon:yes stop_codon:yes gene_type:complete